jgi:hypothetical protein
VRCETQVAGGDDARMTFVRLALAGVLLVLAAGSPALAATPTPSCPRPPSPRRVATAVDGVGEALVVWHQTCVDATQHESDDVVAALGSGPGMFPAAVAISPPGRLADVSQVASDAAGDMWVLGNLLVQGQKIDEPGEPAPGIHGAWVAFRPAGGVFGPAQVLAADAQDVRVASDAAGHVVIGWNTEAHGARLETADATGRRSAVAARPALQLTGLGIDAAGNVTVVGIPARDVSGGAHEVDQVTAAAGRRFSAVRVLARIARPASGCAHRGPAPTVAPPQLAVAPSGEALAAWGVAENGCGNVAVMLGDVTQRGLSGHFGYVHTFTRHFATFVYDDAENVAVDNAGGGLLGWIGGPGGTDFMATRVAVTGIPTSRVLGSGAVSEAVAFNASAVVAAIATFHSATANPVNLWTGSTVVGLPISYPLGNGVDGFVPSEALAVDPAGDALAAWVGPSGVTVQQSGLTSSFGPVALSTSPEPSA